MKMMHRNRSGLFVLDYLPVIAWKHKDFDNQMATFHPFCAKIGSKPGPPHRVQQSAQVRVTSFGYAQLWIALSALIAPRTQAGVGAHIVHIFKTLWIFDLQNKIERSQHSYSRDLLQPKRLRIFCSGHNVDLTLEHGNARA